MAMFCLTGLFMARDKRAEMIVQPADGPSLGVAPYFEIENFKAWSDKGKERLPICRRQSVHSTSGT
jgi:hypothetical protein